MSSSLRSRLQHLCEDLITLTIIDFQSCKWPTRKRIFIAILSQCPSLNEINNELQDIIEYRNNEVNLQRKNNINREERIESETNFRNKFMRIVLKGLERLRWPPSLEAFSDPLDNLFHDNDTFYNAVEFLLEVGISKSSSIRIRIKQKQDEEQEAMKYDEYNNNDNSNIDNTKVYDDISFASNSTQSTIIDNNHNNKKKIKRSPNRSLNNSKALKTTIPGLGIEFIGNLKQNTLPSGRDDSNNELVSIDDSRPTSSSSNFSKASSRRNTANSINNSIMNRPKDYASLLQAFEVLQHQNEILSKELKRVHLVNNAKVTVEEKLTTLLLDLKMSIDDIVSISGEKTTNNKTNSKNADEIISVMKIDVLNVEKMNETKATIKSKSVPMTSTQPKDNSLVIWSKLQSRINDIKRQWDDAITESKKNSCNGFTVHEMTSQYIDNKNISSKRISPNKSLSVPSTARSNTSISSNYTSNSRNPANVPIKFYEVLGIRPPMTNIELNSGIMGDNCSSQSLVFDLPRIHLLQRDLISFAEEAFTILDKNNTYNMTPKSSIFQSFNSENVAETTINSEELEILRLKAQSLLIHVSSFAPIAPLSADFPMSSSMSGLDSLINESIYLQQISKCNKASTLTLQKAADRAKAEHVAILRCLQQNQTCLKSLPNMVKSISPILENITIKTNKIFKKSMEEINQIVESINTLSSCYYDAESSRIKQGASNVNPLDALTRGVMGDATASLVHALRLNIDEIKNLSVKLESIQKKVLYEYNVELEKLTEATNGFLKFESNTSKLINETKLRPNTTTTTTNTSNNNNNNNKTSSSLYKSYKINDKRPSFVL